MNFEKLDITQLCEVAGYELQKDEATGKLVITQDGEILKHADGKPKTPAEVLNQWIIENQGTSEPIKGRGKGDEKAKQAPVIRTSAEFYTHCERNGIKSTDEMAALLINLRKDNPNFLL